MIPPDASRTGASARALDAPAVSVCPEVMRKRSDFLQAARARRRATRGMMVQARRRGPDGAVRVGFTCSKKVGNAVARNRAKRRLREVARLVLPELGKSGWDYVLIGRADVTVDRDFKALVQDFRDALCVLHTSR